MTVVRAGRVGQERRQGQLWRFAEVRQEETWACAAVVADGEVSCGGVWLTPSA